jgi:hypothetical protein
MSRVEAGRLPHPGFWEKDGLIEMIGATRSLHEDCRFVIDVYNKSIQFLLFHGHIGIL